MIAITVGVASKSGGDKGGAARQRKDCALEDAMEQEGLRGRVNSVLLIVVSDIVGRTVKKSTLCGHKMCARL